MPTTVLAFELIAPLIGGVVLTGALSFFVGVLMARRMRDVPVENRAAINPPSQDVSSKFAMPGIASLTDPVAEQIFNQTILHQDNCSSLSALLKWIVPDPVTGFAAIVSTSTDAHFPTISRGLSRLSTENLKITDSILIRLKRESPLFVGFDFDSFSISENLVRWINEIDRDKIQRLCLTALDNGRGIFAVLISSTAWPVNTVESSQRTFMRMTADHVGQRWRHLVSLERQSEELRATRDMLELRSIIDSQSDDPVESLDRFAARLCEMVDADRVAIYFIARRSGEQLQPIVQTGRPYPFGTEAAGHQQEQLLAKMAIDTESSEINDAQWMISPDDGFPIASSVTLPIRINGRVLGALSATLHEDRGSLERNRQLIEFAAETLSHTLRRVFDEATIRRQARHDHLTDLVNRRSLDAHLTDEVERVQRGDSEACSLLLADLDRFKSFNDKYGHQCGDHVLRETARVLSEQVAKLRAGDQCIVARYGGEEFAILLPNVGMAGAMRIAEGIREAVAAERIRVGDTVLQVTLSLGVATIPDGDDTVKSFVANADKALYEAKANGRNCVCRAKSLSEVEKSFA